MKKRKKEIGEDPLFNVIVTLLLGISLFIVAYPIWYIIINSFSSGQAVVTGKVLLYPLDFTLDAYEAIFDHGLLLKSFLNTVLYTTCGTAINVFITVIASYPLSRKELKGRNVITLFFAFTMWFNGGLIPTYMLYKNLNITNNPLVMIIPGALGVWNMVITRTYFQKGIPQELNEAAKLDGCSDFVYLLKIVIPLAKPIIAVITLYYAVGHWNAYFNAMLYIHKTEYYPLQLVLRDILLRGQTIDPNAMASMTPEDIEKQQNLRHMLQYAVIIFGTLPMMILYPFIQKYFVKGIMVGALKG